MDVSREIRRDPFTGEHVVISTDRVTEHKPARGREVDPAECPFCPGHESHTRPTIASIDRDGRWAARAFANRHPVLVVEETPGAEGSGPYERWRGVGAHEVIVEAPEHAPLHALPRQRMEDALLLAVRRIRDLRQDRRIAALQWFRNHGTAAGASQPHPHAQIVGLPVVPDRIRMMTVRASHWQRDHGVTLLGAVLDEERRDPRRMLVDGPEIAAFCAYAPRHPFEVWFAPTSPALGGFGDATEAQVRALAGAMWSAWRALVAVHGEVPVTTYALCGPDHEDTRALGWHVRMAPRLLHRAGLEESTGLATHSVLPELAAELLRPHL